VTRIKVLNLGFIDSRNSLGDESAKKGLVKGGIELGVSSSTKRRRAIQKCMRLGQSKGGG